MEPVVSISTVTLNKPFLVKNCLRSIIERSDVPWDLVIVDNGSTGETRELVQNIAGLEAACQDNEYFCGLRVILNDDNKYICRATNQSFQDRKGQYYAFIPSDTIMSSNYLSKLLKGLEQYQLDGISPRWFEEQHFLDVTDPLGSVDQIGEGRKNGEIFGYKKLPDLEPNWIVGIMYMIKKAVWEQTGGWDEQFLLTVMDNDYAWRAMIHGFQLGIINDVWIFHAGPVTRMDAQQNPGYQKIGDADWQKFIQKWGTNPDDIKFLWALMKERVIRKKTPEDGADEGIPKEIKEKRITNPEYWPLEGKS